MKLELETPPQEKNTEPCSVVKLPLGLMGFTDIKELELVYSQEELPFMHLQQTEANGLEFLVIEPYGLIPDYKVEISDQDIEFLEIKKPEDVLLLNIVTIAGEEKRKVLVNLVGPIIVNRKTQRGKQVVIVNYQDHSAKHLLFEEE